ncbi:MAG: hypothetical protein JWR37_3201, partial [Mycobacterium sp.]|nr:hypothetical protein [Mycobacterium sp.]
MNMEYSEAGATPPPQSAVPSPLAIVPYTQVHALVRRVLENLQDIVAVLLILLLFGLSLEALWRLAHIVALQAGSAGDTISDIMFVLILMEVYRLLIFYLREHRIAVGLAIELALVSTLREVMLRGAHEFNASRLLALSVLITVLG